MSDLPQYALDILNGRRIATLATYNRDGDIHLTALWFLFQDGQLYLPTSSKSRKVHNIAARPRAALIVETRRPGFEQGVTARGAATVLRGDEATPFSHQIHERYLTPKALADPRISAFFTSYDDVVIRLTPASWSFWDMGPLNTEFFGQPAGVESGHFHALD